MSNPRDQIGAGRRDQTMRLGYVDAPPYYISAYGIAVKHGFVGTEEEWLESLHGIQGPQGEQGDPGPQGETGPQGEQGPQGEPTEINGLSGATVELMGDDIPTGAYDPMTVSEALYGRQHMVFRGSIDVSTTWSATEPYMQEIAVKGCSVASTDRIDLQPTAAQLAALAEDGVTALTVENAGGVPRNPQHVGNPVLKLYALGGTPSEAMTIQCTVTRAMTGTKFVRIVPAENAGADITLGTLYQYAAQSDGMIHLIPVEVVDERRRVWAGTYSTTIYGGLVKLQYGSGSTWTITAMADVSFENTTYHANETITSFADGATSGGGLFREVTA